MLVQLRRSSYLSQDGLIQMMFESFCHSSELEVKGDAVLPLSWPRGEDAARPGHGGDCGDLDRRARNSRVRLGPTLMTSDERLREGLARNWPGWSPLMEPGAAGNEAWVVGRERPWRRGQDVSRCWRPTSGLLRQNAHGMPRLVPPRTGGPPIAFRLDSSVPVPGPDLSSHNSCYRA
jgi:hypothetical protein